MTSSPVQTCGKPMAVQARWRAPLLMLAACLLGAVAMVAPAQAQPGSPCLADPNAAASGELGYRQRGTRCEGALERYVSNRANITLVGYHSGTLDFSRIRRVDNLLLVVGAQAGTPVALRAQSLTGQSRYQMDIAQVAPGLPIAWPLDVVRKAASSSMAANLDAFAVVACSARCVDRPDTVYWPVSLADAAPGPLALKLRAGTRANSVSVSLQPSAGGAKPRQWTAEGVGLSPNSVATVPLPVDLPGGAYELVVEARDARTREPVGALYATIVVPAATR